MRPPLPADCPPADATEPDGVYHRFARPGIAIGDPTGPEDWLLSHEEPRSPCRDKTENCVCHSISLLADRAEAEAARKRIPAFRKRTVARVVLTSEMGRIKHSPSRIGDSHHSWWPEPIDFVPDAEVVS